MNNIDICREFFYQENKTFKKTYKAMSYDNDKFYSYYTIIAKKILGKNGSTYVFLSDTNFSMTTNKHLIDLRQACPFDVVYVPVSYNQKDITIAGCIDDITTNLDYYQKSKLTLKANRESYIKYFNMLLTIDEKIQDIKKSIIKKYRDLYDVLTNDELVKELKRKYKKKQKKELERLEILF